MQPGVAALQGLGVALLRRLAERGASVGFVHGLRFAVRGPIGAPELFVLHGLGDSIAGWVRVLGPLSRTHRVHIVDLPGHGLSPPPRDFRRTCAPGVSVLTGKKTLKFRLTRSLRR